MLLAELAKRPATEARALVYDLSDAPDVWGPTTQRALQRLLAPWEAAHRRIIVVVGAEAIQRISVESLLKSSAPNMGRIADSLVKAEALLAKAK